MPIFDLFSKRQKRLRGEMPDVYVYDDLPPPLRVQIVHIWKDTTQHYKFIVDTLCREYGVFVLADMSSPVYTGIRDYQAEFFKFFLEEENCEKALDAIELSFRFIDRDDATEELNRVCTK